MTIDEVRRAFNCSPPGLEAQARMAPPYRRDMIRQMLNPPACRQAGVLVLLYPQHGQLHFPLTKRPDSVEFHKGQISLPGGSQENGESFAQTALREAKEEIGADSSAIEVIGGLSRMYVPPSNFCIYPFVGYAPRRPDFRLETHEVAELIEAPLDTLLDPATARVEEWEIRGQVWPIPFYQFGPHKVWGATAMILAELAAILTLGTPRKGVLGTRSHRHRGGANGGHSRSTIELAQAGGE